MGAIFSPVSAAWSTCTGFSLPRGGGSRRARPRPRRAWLWPPGTRPPASMLKLRPPRATRPSEKSSRGGGGIYAVRVTRGRKESAGSAARPPRWSRSRARAQELSRGGACGAPRPPDLLQWKMAPRGEHTQTRWRCRTKKHFPQDNDRQDRHGKVRGLSMSASQVRHEHNVNAVVRNRRGQLHFQGRGARMPHGEHFPPGRKAARKEVEEEPARAVLSKHAHGLPPFRAPGGRVRRRFGAPPGRHRRR